MATGETPAARAPWTPGLARLVVSLGVMHVALYVVYMGVLQLLLPHQLWLIDPARKVELFGAVTGVAAIVATVANPIAGALSDRTRSPLGRRTPWLIAVALLATPALVLLGSMTTLIGVVFGMCLIQAVMNFFQAPLAAVLPERVPAERRGVASAAIGLGVPLGIVFGTAVGARFLPNLPIAYAALGVVFALAAFAFVALNPDRAAPAESAPRPQAGLAAFFAALRDSDFRWTFASRFLINLTYCATTSFHLYLLQDHVGLGAGPETARTLVQVNAAGMTAMVLATLAAGWLSDAVRRRKVFVSAAAAFLAASALTPIFLPTVEGMYLFAICNGLGMGSYLAVDTVLVTQVLPNKAAHARDLGIFNIASAGPQIMGPFFASLIVAHFGGYAAMLAYGSAMAAISALAILNVRRVR